MAILAKEFSGAGSEYTSDPVAHAGGIVQLVVAGSPSSGGTDCKVTILKEIASPVSAYKELQFAVSKVGDIIRFPLEASNIKFKVTAQNAGASFTVELTTV